jgi:hypothetical protein
MSAIAPLPLPLLVGWRLLLARQHRRQGQMNGFLLSRRHGREIIPPRLTVSMSRDSALEFACFP